MQCLWPWQMTGDPPLDPGRQRLLVGEINFYKQNDPFKNCEAAGKCNHDLVRGVLVYEELWKEDGPMALSSTYFPPPQAVIRDGRIQRE